MTNIIMLIGDLGGGKTTFACLVNRIWAQQYPNAPRIANTNYKDAYKVEDTNKFMAIKLIKDDKNYALVTTDEAAQAGLESRGSGSKESAIESRVISLARKAHCDVMLITQLMSMIDKRGQWLSVLYVLCEAVFEADNPTPFPDYFEYTVYDHNLKEIDGWEVTWEDAAKHIFPHMDTDDIPYKKNLEAMWIQWYNMTTRDEEEFDKIMGIKSDRRFPEFEPSTFEYGTKRWLRMGDIVAFQSGTKKGKVVSKEWDTENDQWYYTLERVGESVQSVSIRV